jgi:hypothetical protein
MARSRPKLNFNAMRESIGRLRVDVGCYRSRDLTRERHCSRAAGLIRY